MRIGIIGSGNMGRTLGGAWAGVGYQVFFGSRDEQKGRGVANAIGHGTRGGTSDEAAEFGEAVFYTVRRLPSEFLSSPQRLSGKILIDCNNRPLGEGLSFGPPPIPSFAERLAQDVEAARVVKCLNPPESQSSI